MCTVSMGRASAHPWSSWITRGSAARASLLLTIPLREPASPFCGVGGDTEAQSCRGARPVGVSCQVTQRPASWSSPPWAVTPMLSWGCWGRPPAEGSGCVTSESRAASVAALLLWLPCSEILPPGVLAPREAGCSDVRTPRRSVEGPREGAYE